MYVSASVAEAELTNNLPEPLLNFVGCGAENPSSLEPWSPVGPFIRPASRTLKGKEWLARSAKTRRSATAAAAYRRAPERTPIVGAVLDRGPDRAHHARGFLQSFTRPLMCHVSFGPRRWLSIRRRKRAVSALLIYPSRRASETACFITSLRPPDSSRSPMVLSIVVRGRTSWIITSLVPMWP